jgi:hypothetical protein
VWFSQRRRIVGLTKYPDPGLGGNFVATSVICAFEPGCEIVDRLESGALVAVATSVISEFEPGCKMTPNVAAGDFLG